MNMCMGCSRKLPKSAGRMLQDDEGIWIWVCYECMPKEKNETK